MCPEPVGSIIIMPYLLLSLLLLLLFSQAFLSSMCTVVRRPRSGSSACEIFPFGALPCRATTGPRSAFYR